MKDIIILGGSHDTSTPQSSYSLPRSSTFSPPQLQSSPFSPILAKFEDFHFKEYHSYTVIAGIKIGGPHLDDSFSDHDPKEEEGFREDLFFEEEGTSQPSEMVSPTVTSAVHRDVKYNTGD